MRSVRIEDFKNMTEGTVLKIFPSDRNREQGEKPLVGEYRGFKQGMGAVEPSNDQIIIRQPKEEGGWQTFEPRMHEISGFEIIEARDWPR